MKLEIEVTPIELFDIIRIEVYKPDNIGLHHLNDYNAHDIQMLCYSIDDNLPGVQSLDTLFDCLCNKKFVNNLIRVGRKTYGSRCDCSTWLYTL